VVRLEIPPLRQRPEDLPVLIAHFLDKAKASHPASPVQAIGRDALSRLTAHSWPGNVRELQNVIERVVLLGRSKEVQPGDLPPDLGVVVPEEARFEGPILPLAELERRYARWAITQLGGRKMLTAEKLEIDRKTLARLLEDERE
jgi:two-component system response regulator HydG